MIPEAEVESLARTDPGRGAEVVLGLGLKSLRPRHRADEIRRDQCPIRWIPDQHGVSLRERYENGHRSRAWR